MRAIAMSNIVLFFVIMFLIVLGMSWLSSVRAHEHAPGESTEQARIVGFYKTWKRPKGEFAITHRQSYCCYGDGARQDCFPVLKERVNEKGIREVMPDVTGAHPQAQTEYGNKWYPLNYGIEENKQPDPRESPDGRSHVCVSGMSAICYVPGYGN